MSLEYINNQQKAHNRTFKMLQNSTSTYNGHKKSINCLSSSIENVNIILSGSDDKTIRTWDTRTKKTVKCLCGFTNYPIEDILINKVNPNILHTSSNKSLYTFDVRMGNNEILLKIPIMTNNNIATSNINTISSTKDGKKIIIGDDDGIITVLDYDTIDCIDCITMSKQLIVHNSIINSLYIHDDDDYVTSGGFDYKLCKTNIVNGNCMLNTNINTTTMQTQIVNPPFIQTVKHYQDDNYNAILCALGDGTIHAYQQDNHRFIAKSNEHHSHKHMVTCLEILTNINIIVSGSVDKKIKLWSISNKNKKKRVINNIFTIDHNYKINTIVKNSNNDIIYVADTSDNITEYTYV